MAYEIFLPKLGANMTQGRIVHWFVGEGQPVDIGDPLFEMVTDKASVEVEAENRGILKKIIAGEGARVPIAEAVGIIGGKDENIRGLLDEIARRKDAQKIPEVESKELEEPVAADDQGEPGPATMEIQRMMHAPMHSSEAPGIKASPRARRRARQAGINLADIKPSRGDTITHEDVETYILFSSRPRKCVIIGAGQYSGVIREILEKIEKLEIEGYLDDNPALDGKKIDGLPVLGRTNMLAEIARRGVNNFIVSVGEPHLRAQLFQRAVDAGLKPISAIHPRACISKNALIEDGCVVEAHSLVSIRSTISRGTFITQNCSISHDCRLGEFSHMAPGSHLGGMVRIGRGVLIGIGGAVSPNIEIGDNVIVAPGTSVDRNVAPGCVMEGCPGRVIGARSESTRI